jgi:imidazolonepropionase-like amidohydrolase
MNVLVRIILFSLACGVVAASGSTVLPARPQTTPVLLRGGTVFPVSGPPIQDGEVLFADGEIVAVGRALRVPPGTEIVDTRGRHVYPGLIAACTRLGLAEISAVRPTVDTVELGTMNPSVRAQVAINPESALIPVARANGVLTALSVPAVRPHSIAGTSALIRLDGWTWEDMTLRAEAALHVYWPSMAVDRRATAKTPPAAQAAEISATIASLDEALAQARAYAAERAGAGAEGKPVDLSLAALVPVVRGERKVFVHADEVKQILAALAWAKRQGLTITLVGAVDAWRVVDTIREAGVGVVLTGVNRLPLRRDDPYDAVFALPAALHAAGVPFCISTHPDATSGFGNERNVPYEAAKAVGYGLPAEVALASVTLEAARMLGVGDELGSLEVGKRATLIVTDGDILQIPTRVEAAFVDGARIDLRSRHTELYEKYRERIERLRSR